MRKCSINEPGARQICENLACTIHDGSWRNRAVASRDGRVEPRRREAYSRQYVDRLSGEPARLRACPGSRRQACRSSECAIAAEVFMNNAGYVFRRASRTSRTLWAKVRGEKGFWRNALPESRWPWWTTALSA